MSCKGPIWNYDDIQPCQRHWYFQLVPLSVACLVSLLIFTYSLLPYIRSHARGLSLKHDHEYRPLLAEDTQNDTPAHPDTVFSHSTIENSHPPSQKDTSSPDAYIVTVVRSTAERVRVTAECLAVVCQVALAIAAVNIPSIRREWSKDYSQTPVVSLTFWIYALGLVALRLYSIQRKSTPIGHPWTHSTSLYCVALVFALVNVRSALLHPISLESRNYYIAYAFLSFSLVCLNLSATTADRPARIYVTPGLKPSAEPIRSLFSLLTFSWINELVWRGYQAPLKMEDIYDLRESDHTANVLERFRRISKRYSLGSRLIIHFKKELLISCSAAVINASFTFVPTILLRLILEYVDDPSRTTTGVAWMYVFLIFTATIFNNLTAGVSLFIGRRICIRLRAIIIGEVYAKTLKRKAASKSSQSLEKKDATASQDQSDGPVHNDESLEPNSANTGAIMNLMAVDAFKVSEISGYLHYLVTGVLLIIIALVLLFGLLGWSALAGAALLFALTPLNYKISKRLARMQEKLMALTDQRIEKTDEVLQSIRVIKYFAWERRFAQGVYEIRDKELAMLRKQFLLWSLGTGLWYLSPVLTAVGAFGCYTLVAHNNLTSPVAFTALSLFNLMRSPMDQLTEIINSVLQSKVSVDRVERFLNEEETGKYEQLSSSQLRGPNTPELGFENASFCWMRPNYSDELEGAEPSTRNKQFNFKLHNLDIEFKVGELNVVAGPTGSGKSSLLMALLGEMELLEGRVSLPNPQVNKTAILDPETGLRDSVAYCAQQAWLLNDTLRNNIIFASEYDDKRYNEVLDVCSLRRDLEILDAGDQTEIGEKGINLSGGQRQRISLARAIYSNCKHILLDDCLSAVDSHTALDIYERCLTGRLCQGRTRILISHNVALTITQATFLVVLRNGKVEAQGTPAQVVSSGVLGDDELLRSSASGSHAVSRQASPERVDAALASSDRAAINLIDGTEPNGTVTKKRDGKLVQEEVSSQGSVKRAVYAAYVSAMGGMPFFSLMIFFYILYQAVNVLQSWWLREWASNTPEQAITSIHSVSFTHGLDMTSARSILSVFSLVGSRHTDPPVHTSASAGHGTVFYLSLYAVIGFVTMAAGVVKEIATFTGSLRASRTLFSKLLESVLGAKLRFFDTTPVGRVINRFSKDVEAVDQELAAVSTGFLHCMLSAISIIVLIGVITPKFLFAGIFIAGLYWVIAVLYLNVSRELKRYDSTTKSPIFQHFGETLSGVSTIRAYGVEDRFIRSNYIKIDTNHRCFFFLWMTNRWLSFRIDTAGALVSFSAATFVLLNVGRMDPGLAGLSLSYALNFNEMVLWIVRLYAAVEMSMNSVERVTEYLDIEAESSSNSRPPSDWPVNGDIEVENLCLRYAPDLPAVIQDVSFSVASNEKIGIVGRTGAGKSTIITAFFRFLEAEKGSIKIDGLDIATIGLRDLRRKLAIIPQDPTLFKGTVRSNLDPFHEYADGEVFDALRRVHLLSDAEQSVPLDITENRNQFENLDSVISEGGNNLSQGQRQLMCLARALLKRPKVLLMDEATASIDNETDARIQETIRKQFVASTILTIAHRLRSIADYDKILVMDAGRVAEFDQPHVLLQRKDSIFRGMCENSGELSALLNLAESAYKGTTAS